MFQKGFIYIYRSDGLLIYIHKYISIYISIALSTNNFLIHSDEGLKLETPVFESFYGVEFTYSTSWLITSLRVSLSHQSSAEFLWKFNPLFQETRNTFSSNTEFNVRVVWSDKPPHRKFLQINKFATLVIMETSVTTRKLCT